MWLNVRTTPLPAFAPVDGALIEAKLDENRHVCNPFSLGFFIRSLVLSPDGKVLLNPEANDAHDVTGSGTAYLNEGHFAYAEHRPQPYLDMLFRALEKWGEVFPQQMDAHALK